MERLLRFVANENISGTVIERLRAAGHDVLSVKETMRGQTDTAILARVQDEERVLITQDKGFGELAFRWGLPVSCGAILLRLGGDDSKRDNRRAIQAILSRADWVGHFSVVSDDRIRTRSLPSAAPKRGESNG